MRDFFKYANSERGKWLAVILLGVCLMGINHQLESLPSEIIRLAIDFISGFEGVKLS